MLISPQDRDSPRSRLILCEKTGQWAARLRSVMPVKRKWTLETRSLLQLGEALRDNPASLAIVEITAANLQPALQAIGDWRDRFRSSQFVVATERGREDFAWAAREAGAIGAVIPRQLETVARIWRRHAEHFPPKEDEPLQPIWDRLPLA